MEHGDRQVVQPLWFFTPSANSESHGTKPTKKLKTETERSILSDNMTA